MLAKMNILTRRRSTTHSPTRRRKTENLVTRKEGVEGKKAKQTSRHRQQRMPADGRRKLSPVCRKTFLNKKHGSSFPSSSSGGPDRRSLHQSAVDEPPLVDWAVFFALSRCMYTAHRSPQHPAYGKNGQKERKEERVVF